MRPPLKAGYDYRSLSTPALLIAVVALAASTQWVFRDPEWQSFLTVTFVHTTLAVGMYTFIGNSGIFSFGHMVFAAVGGYTAGLVTIDPVVRRTLLTELPGPLRTFELPWLAAVLLGGLTALLVALVLWTPLMRLSGLAAVLATAAFMLVVNGVLRNWTPVTNGSAGLPAIPIRTTVPIAALAVSCAILLSFAYQASRRGLLLRTLRENEPAALAAGARPVRERIAALLVSAFITGCGGALLALLVGSITPDTFYLHLTFLTIAMIVVGGMSSLSGAVVGAVVVATTMELLRRVELGPTVAGVHIPARPGISEVGLAVLLLCILWFRPTGLFGTRELQAGRARGAAPAHGPPADPAGADDESGPAGAVRKEVH